MWRSIFAGIRACLKKTLGVCVTAIAYVVDAVRKMIESTKSAALSGANWVAEQCKTVPVKQLSKVAMLRAFVLFVGGFICCFLFPEDAKGDLTWFERMLTSAMDWSSTLITATKDRVVEWVQFKYRRSEVT